MAPTIPPHSLAWLWRADDPRQDLHDALIAAHRRYLDRFDGQAPAGIYHSAGDCPQPIHAGAITSQPAGNVAARHLFFVVS